MSTIINHTAFFAVETEDGGRINFKFEVQLGSFHSHLTDTDKWTYGTTLVSLTHGREADVCVQGFFNPACVYDSMSEALAAAYVQIAEEYLQKEV